MAKFKSIVHDQREQEANVKVKMQMTKELKKAVATDIKVESHVLKKKIKKKEKIYLRMAQERRFEQQLIQEASKIKNEQSLIQKLETTRLQKNDEL